MALSSSGSPAITNASRLETKGSAKTGMSFLSLPPEIRLMIYDYLLTPEKDGTCRAIYVDEPTGTLKGCISTCEECVRKLAHTNCLLSRLPKGVYGFLFLANGRMHTNIMQTCRTTLDEISPILLNYTHFSIFGGYNLHNYYPKPLRLLLSSLHQLDSSFLPKLTFYIRDLYKLTDEKEAERDYDCHKWSFAHLVNQQNIRIGCLEIVPVMDSFKTGSTFTRNLVRMLESLEQKPASIRLVTSSWLSFRYGNTPDNFNEAARRWLEKLAKTKAEKKGSRLPLLRDYLPQYFDGSES